jgi:hypothetical protein
LEHEVESQLKPERPIMPRVSGMQHPYASHASELLFKAVMEFALTALLYYLGQTIAGSRKRRVPDANACCSGAVDGVRSAPAGIPG